MTDTTADPHTTRESDRPAGATYVYGIVDADHPCRFGEIGGVGDPATTLRRLDAGRVAAVVSEAPCELRAKRRDVLAHQRVLDEISRQGTVLPMRFGVIAQDELSLREELVEDADTHLAMLADLQDRSEINIKVFSDEDELIREVAISDPTVRGLRERQGTSMEDRIQLGEAVSAAIQARNDAIARQLVQALEPLATRTVEGPAVKGAAVNTSFLVDRDRTAAFVDTVDRLDDGLGPDIRIQRTGPLPPYSFVDVRE